MSNRGLGRLEIAVLGCVGQLGGEAYGLSIRHAVSDLQRRDYSVGAIYTTLSRLEEKGLVASWLSDPLPVRGGRSRRHFKVTGEGRKALREAAEIAAQMWNFQLGVDPV
jgi:DNA-binding PadR family transcriptional regulator